MRTLLQRLLAAPRRHAGLLTITLLALAVRLVWNLVVHPPASYDFSDMGGYIGRANEMFDGKWVPRPHVTLFPWGTHAFVFVIKAVFGKKNAPALGVAFALLGTAAVSYSYATARRLYPKRPWVAAAVGLSLVVYYPWISLGGYVLSETPFCLGIAATAFYSLRLADRGRGRDALLFGLSAALGAIARPQLLLALPLIGLHFLVRRRAWRNVRRRNAVFVAIPIALVLGVSIARIEFHNKHFGLVSTNGPLNFAFGRCHPTTIEAKTRGSSGFFGPPALGALASYGKKHPHALFKLNPANGSTLKVRGTMWDEAVMGKLSRDCIERTGWAGQASYALTHVVLLYAYNSVWPDAGLKEWRAKMAPWGPPQLFLVVPALIFAFARAHRRRRARELLIGVHLWALVLTAILYFGDTRYRAPYDGIVFALVLPVYADLALLLLRFVVGLGQGAKPPRAAFAAVAPAAAAGAATLGGP